MAAAGLILEPLTMRIGITGARGFIGQHLARALGARGHGCVAFSRSDRDAVPGCVETRAWGAGAPDLGGLDAVVNLVGESILGLWTDAKRRRIRESRAAGTAALVGALPGSGVHVLVNASAVGFYGDRGDEELTEDRPPGEGFLSEVCREWEAAAMAAANVGEVRVAVARIGFVLGADGGAWPLLRRAFRLGLGGRLGDGKQWMSPVHVADVAGLFVALVENDAAHGAFNAVGPEPVRNAEFTRAVAHALHRPAVLPAPAWALRTVLGDTSHVMLDSVRAVPARAGEIGYAFRFSTLAAMLAEVVG